MRGDRIDRIVDAVLYEGYMLYPYRASSVKNRQRWNFGVVVPEAYHRVVDPSERYILKTQCLVEAGEQTSVQICVRFLQLLKREVKGGDSASPGALEDCDETIDREMGLGPFHPLRDGPLRMPIDLPATQSRNMSRAGIVFRSSEAIHGEAVVETVSIAGGAARIAISITNRTPLDSIEQVKRHDALRRSLLSAHLVLTVHDGAFVSLLDPGESFREAAGQCAQDGLYPVLVGEEGDRQNVLAAPIILYDHPQVAPESPDNLFDGTEIDEILTLRIQTLSDAEKEEIRAADARTRELLERAEAIEPEVLARLHGGLRPATPARPAAVSPWDPYAPSGVDNVVVAGRELRRGDRVRLRPQKTADIMDLALAGREAVIEAIEQDLEDRILLAVVVDDDPGQDMGLLRQPGHRFFFSPEEVEPLVPRSDLPKDES